MVGQAHGPINSSRALVSFPVVQGARSHLRCDGDEVVVTTGKMMRQYHSLKRGRHGFQKHRDRGYPEGHLGLFNSPFYLGAPRDIP